VLVDSRPTVQFSPFLRKQREAISDITGRIAVDTVKRAAEPAHVATLRALAAHGDLAVTVATASPVQRVALSGATFAIAWPVVFARLTSGLERNRGHLMCASSLFKMRDECLDRFYEDLEAVIDDVLAHATMPIRNLEAWIASRLTKATVDAHRRRRGEIGALQRPRLPKWLADRLSADPWLCDLAVQILVWVGIGVTAGTQLWPLEGWSARRAAITGDVPGSEPAVVGRDVETVLAAMRTKEKWFADHVEGPLGHKRAPVLSALTTVDLPPLVFTERADIDDTHLVVLASAVLRAIGSGLGAGLDVRAVVVEAIGAAFGVDTTGREMDCPPHAAVPDYEACVNAALGDPAQVDRIVAAALRILR
jgi:hypothetical protein